MFLYVLLAATPQYFTRGKSKFFSLSILVLRKIEEQIIFFIFLGGASFSNGDLSREGDGTLPKNSYYPSQGLLEAR